MALQPGRGKIEGRHYLPSTPETVTWGDLPNALTKPVLSIDSGATVTFDTVSPEGILGDQGRDPDAFLAALGVPHPEVLADARAIATSGLPHRFGLDAPHIVTGPVLVRGAQPGDMLRVDVVSLHPRARYGIVSTRHGDGLFAGEFPEGGPPERGADARHWQRFGTLTTFCAVERRRGRLFGVLASANGTRARFPLAPFLGVMAVAVDSTTEVLPSTSVGLHGGALDCGDLGPGTRLYLPVQVVGALLAVGDPHYALADGKIGATALEGPLRATLRLTALRDAATSAALGALREPFIETDTAWVTMGVDAELPEAIRRAARSAVQFLHSRMGLERAEAFAYLSAAGHLAVGHLGPGTQTAFCRIRRADFIEPAPAKSRLPRPAFVRLVGAGDPTGPDTDRDEQAQATPETDPALPRLDDTGAPDDRPSPDGTAHPDVAMPPHGAGHPDALSEPNGSTHPDAGSRPATPPRHGTPPTRHGSSARHGLSSRDGRRSREGRPTHAARSAREGGAPGEAASADHRVPIEGGPAQGGQPETGTRHRREPVPGPDSVDDLGPPPLEPDGVAGSSG